MHVLHLHWLTPTRAGREGGLLLWAETAAAPHPSRDRRRKSAQTHPFAAGTDDLRGLRTTLGWRSQLPTDALTLWLPTNRFGPSPSPQLLHEWETDDGPPDLLPWTVAGLRLNIAQSLSLLTHLHQTDLPPLIRLGSDGRFWQSAFAFVLELLARQLFRPRLVERRQDGERPVEARWQPLLDSDSEARRAAQLAAAMPTICRADTDDPNQTIPPRAILDSFLNHVTDAAVRDWGTKQELHLPSAPDPANAWLRALFAAIPTIQASAGQRQHFASSFRAWERALSVAGDSHYRVALRLEAPTQ